jgi:single-strand DNA-binding protein
MAGKSLNKVMLIGNAGKDTEIRYTGNGKAVASFSLATGATWNDKASGQMQERTDWHNIVAWDRLAEICGQYVKKGKRIYVEGRIQTRSYDDKDGVKKYVTEIVASDMILLDGGGQAGGNSEGFNNAPAKTYARPAAAAASGPAPAPVPDYEPMDAPPADDLPF